MYRDRLDKLFHEAISLLHSGEFDSCQSLIASAYSCDDLLEECQVAKSCPSEEASPNVAAEYYLESAVGELISAAVLERQCQLDLIRAIISLEKSNVSAFLHCLAELLDRAAFLDFGDDLAALESVVDAALNFNRCDSLTCSRLAVWMSRQCMFQCEWTKAKSWLARVNLDDAPMFRESVSHLAKELAAKFKNDAVFREGN